MKRICLLVSIGLLVVRGYSQHLHDADSLLIWIENQQVKSDAFYDAGLFRSERIYGRRTYEDNTLFNASIIALTLQSVSDRMSKGSQERIRRVYDGVRGNAWRYQSRRGRAAFNYWQTDPDIPHPNGPAKYQTDKYKIPDDFDDTSLIGLLLDSAALSMEIRKEMVRYTAAREKKVKTTFVIRSIQTTG